MTAKTHFSFLRTARAVSLVVITASLIGQNAVAQVVADQAVPDAQLAIPANAQLFGQGNPNVYRPSATVNGEIITATDVEQRLALIRIANNGQIPPEELQRLRVQVFSNLIDEHLQIQEAAANKVEVTDAEINQEFERVAANLRQTPEQFAQFLAANGASAAALKQQIKGDIAWQNLLGRNIEPFTNVSEEEVRSLVDRMQSERGLVEYRVGEIYLPATQENIASVVETAGRIMQSLAQGTPFQEQARRFSQASTASVGGDLGWIRINQLPTAMSEAVQGMQPGQLAGPIEVPGGVSILLLIDRRQVLTVDPRDAVLSLKQITLSFPAGTTESRATELASNFNTRTRSIAGCGQVEEVARELGADVTGSDQISMRDLPPALQAEMAQLQVGQVTPPFGSPTTAVNVLVLCGRDVPSQAALPSTEDLANQMRQERVNRRAQRYLRDLRRDAVIEYN